MAVTIKDVARVCNVSIATVSRVINEKTEGISDKTRELIKKTIKELNYQPNGLARSMITKKTKTIGLVIPDVRNPFFSELARGVEDVCNRNGYGFFLCNTDGHFKKEAEYILLLKERLADGILFTTQNDIEYNDAFKRFQQERFPFLFIERYVDSLHEVPGVFVDNFKAAFDITEFIINHGHREIAFISGPLSTKNAQLRKEGYAAALANHGIPLKKGLIAEGNYKDSGGYKAIQTLCKKGTIPFSALFAANDLMAFGAYQALEERGVSIPEDVSIAGFDNTPFPEVFRPKLTTMEIPAYKMGETSAEMLLTLLKGNTLKKTRIVYSLELVDKGSVRRI